MDFSYDGSMFNGYERQKNLHTVQGVIEDVLTSVNGNKKVNIYASGRTDKGVHARHQMAHFNLDKDIKLYGIKDLINKKCEGIYVNSIKKVNDKFHARYDVRAKTYSYYINTKDYDVFKRNYVYQYNKKLDINAIKKASSCLLGEHNFKSFCNGSKEKENFIRNISTISIEDNDGIVKISITGNGFLRSMVRNIVGVMLDIGSGKKDISYMEYVLNLCDRKSFIVKSAYSGGLYLEEVLY